MSIPLCLLVSLSLPPGTAPLTAVQLLWVNLIMDTLGALALATEPPKEELMSLPPVGRRVPFITSIMWRNIIGQAVFQLAVLAVLGGAGESLFFLSGPQASGIKKTLIFNTFVFCQVPGVVAWGSCQVSPLVGCLFCAFRMILHRKC